MGCLRSATTARRNDGSIGTRRFGPQRGRRIRTITRSLGTTNMLAHQPTWTVERIELLKNRFEAGLSCREIANDIGVSRNAVIGKLSRLNLTREKNGDARRAARKDAPKAPRGRAVPRLQYQMLRALYADPPPADDDEPTPYSHTLSPLHFTAQTA